MATDNSNYDPLRNPQVDYERADLSARGIVLFLVGLLVAGVFIELVLWGMFRFMAQERGAVPAGPAESDDERAEAGARACSALGAAEHAAGEHRMFPGAAPASATMRLTWSKFLASEQETAESAAAVHGSERGGPYSDFAGDEADRGARIAGAAECAAAGDQHANRGR